MRRRNVGMLLLVLALVPSAAQSDDDPVFDELLGNPVSAAPAKVNPSSTDPSKTQGVSKLEEFGSLPKQTEPLELREVPAGEHNEISNIEFSMDGVISRIAMSSKYKLHYRQADTAKVKQVVVLFDNTTTPHRLQRAYDTTEFKSPVAMFTLLQMPKKRKKDPLTKLIIQLREDKLPKISEGGGTLVFEFPAADGNYAKRSVATEDKDTSTEENIYSGEQVFTGAPIRRLEIKNSDVQDVLRFLAKSSGYNIVIGEDVSGKVGTLSLENLPWDQAFALVLQSKKLGYVRQGNVLRIGTLAALKAEKLDAADNETAKIKAEPLQTVLIPISYAKASSLTPRAKTFLTDRGSVDVDDRSNTIIVHDVRRSIERLQKLFSVLDTQPPMVSVSARFVEVSTNWTRDISPGLGLAGNTSGINFGTNNKLLDTPGFFYAPNSTNPTLVLNAPTFASLTASLSLTESDGTAKTIGNPTVSVQQNEHATITATETRFTNSSTIVNGATVVSWTPTSASINLDVTPVVAGDGSILLTTNLQNQVFGNGQSGQPDPINSRTISTNIILENGDTAVIGGLFTENSNESVSGVPFLMRLPILGVLFGERPSKIDRQEILIFLTARLMNPEAAFKRNL